MQTRSISTTPILIHGHRLLLRHPRLLWHPDPSISGPISFSPSRGRITRAMSMTQLLIRGRHLPMYAASLSPVVMAPIIVLWLVILFIVLAPLLEGTNSDLSIISLQIPSQIHLLIQWN